MSEYPKALYKGKHYTDWQQFCMDLENKLIQSCIVTSKAQEHERRAEGFTDASVLMEPMKIEGTLTLPKKRGMPKGGWPKHGNPQ